jgi:hypothetical protein
VELEQWRGGGEVSTTGQPLTAIHVPPADFATRLDELTAAGRQADAAKLFMTKGMGAPGVFVNLMRPEDDGPLSRDQPRRFGRPPRARLERGGARRLQPGPETVVKRPGADGWEDEHG